MHGPRLLGSRRVRTTDLVAKVFGAHSSTGLARLSVAGVRSRSLNRYGKAHPSRGITHHLPMPGHAVLRAMLPQQDDGVVIELRIGIALTAHEHNGRVAKFGHYGRNQNIAVCPQWQP